MKRNGAQSRSFSGLVLAALVASVLASESSAELAAEPTGRVVELPATPRPHWIWASDAIHRRIALIDVESERLLGVVNGGWGLTAGLFSPDGRSIYVPETHYSRGSRGDRTDVVTFYDAATLRPTAEVVLPPKRASNALPIGNAAISDDGRFVAVFNMTPATSVSIVDVREAAFVQEIETPGCSLVYDAGPRRFMMLCSDGSALFLDLDDRGSLVRRVRTDAFFDPLADPVTEKGVRAGSHWYFVSFEGHLHGIDVTADAPEADASWSLLGEADRRERWRIGGTQHLALHEASGRLYVLMHQGEVDTHKDGGTQLWVYDLAKRERAQRIELHSPGFTYLGVPMEFGEDWVWPFNALYGWLVDASVPYVGIGNVVVTQDDAPLIVTGANFSGSLAIYDALTGSFRGRVTTGNMTTLILQSAWRPGQGGGKGGSP